MNPDRFAMSVGEFFKMMKEGFGRMKDYPPYQPSWSRISFAISFSK